MSAGIKWRTNWNQALEEARDTDKNLVADFFLPGCIGCEQMTEKTYSDASVRAFLNTEVVPLKLDPNGPLSERFFVRWTPVILGLDAQGNEHHRQVGFLPPEHYLPALMLMNAKCFFAHRVWPRALDWFARIVEEQPQSFAAPEAVYLGAVSRTRIEENSLVMKAAEASIKETYPDSEWAARMLPYRLLPR